MIGNSHTIVYDEERTKKYRQGQLSSTDFGSWDAYFRYREFLMEKEEKEDTAEQKRTSELNRRKLHQDRIRKEKDLDEEYDTKPKRKHRRKKNRGKQREKDKQQRKDMYKKSDQRNDKNSK